MFLTSQASGQSNALRINLTISMPIWRICFFIGTAMSPMELPKVSLTSIFTRSSMSFIKRSMSGNAMKLHIFQALQRGRRTISPASNTKKYVYFELLDVVGKTETREDGTKSEDSKKKKNSS